MLKTGLWLEQTQGFGYDSPHLARPEGIGRLFQPGKRQQFPDYVADPFGRVQRLLDVSRTFFRLQFGPLQYL